MIDLNLLILYILAVIVMIAVPGPVAVMVVSAGVSGGARRALLTVAGTNLASLVLIALAALLVKGLLTVDAALFASIKLCGALYVGYLGWGMLRTCAGSTFDGAAIGAGVSEGGLPSRCPIPRTSYSSRRSFHSSSASPPTQTAASSY